MPFARAVIVYGDPIDIPFDADRQEMEVKRLALQEALDRLTQEAERLAHGVRSRSVPGTRGGSSP